MTTTTCPCNCCCESSDPSRLGQMEMTIIDTAFAADLARLRDELDAHAKLTQGFESSIHERLFEMTIKPAPGNVSFKLPPKEPHGYHRGFHKASRKKRGRAHL